MAALSKFDSGFQKGNCLPFNCYEVGHTWTPYCSEAALEVGVYCMGESLKIYTPLYILSLIFGQKVNRRILLKTLENIMISSCFLSFNAFAFIAALCSVSKTIGKISLLHCSYFPSLLANFLAILIERPSRRPALALYCTNMASETLYRMALDRKLFTPIPNGAVLLFSVVMATFLYLMRRDGFDNDFVSIGLRFLLGEDEAKRKQKSLDKNSNGTATFHLSKEPKQRTGKFSEFFHFCIRLVQFGQTTFSKVIPIPRISLPHHRSCPHSDSCLLYVLKGFLRPFLAGYASSAMLGLFAARAKITRKLGTALKVLQNPETLRFAFFLGGFASVFKLASCSLRWLHGKDMELHAIPAGLLAGFTMALSPNPSVSLYLAWKLIEVLVHTAVRHGFLPSIKGASVMLYSLSTAVLFYAAVMEPHNLQPTYRKFLNRLSANRLDEINRHVLDNFGLHSSKLHHGFWPSLDIKYTSRKFQEAVLVWMIH